METYFNSFISFDLPFKIWRANLFDSYSKPFFYFVNGITHHFVINGELKHKIKNAILDYMYFAEAFKTKLIPFNETNFVWKLF